MQSNEKRDHPLTLSTFHFIVTFNRCKMFKLEEARRWFSFILLWKAHNLEDF